MSKTTKTAFLIDEIDNIKTYKDTSFALMLKCQELNYSISFFTISDMSINQGIVEAKTTDITISDQKENWYQITKKQQIPLNQYDIVFIRKEPPFSQHYLYATQMLDMVAKEGIKVLNNPKGIRDFNEKIYSLHFKEFAPKTLISSNSEQITKFIHEEKQAILKPLDGMGGSSIFKVNSDDSNCNVIIETLTQHSTKHIVCQEFLPEIKEGDRRIIIAAGKVIPFCLNRIPQGKDHRGNIAAGGLGQVEPVSEENMNIANQIAKELIKHDLLLVGLDMIGNKVTEINITSPTCVREITAATNIDITGMILDYIKDKK